LKEIPEKLAQIAAANNGQKCICPDLLRPFDSTHTALYFTDAESSVQVIPVHTPTSSSVLSIDKENPQIFDSDGWDFDTVGTCFFQVVFIKV
jgi:hypothetical protein